MAVLLNPEPMKLKTKLRGPQSEDLMPSSLQLTDLSKEQCCGVLVEEGVAVADPQHIWALVKLGSYGKGVFSRSIPCHQHISSLHKTKQVSGKKRASLAEEGVGDEIEMSPKKRRKLHLHTKQESKTTLFVEGLRTEEQEINESSIEQFKDDSCQHLEEYLQLGAEEALYLAAEAKVLSVVNTKAVILTENELWVHFSQLNHSFPARYAAYAHYRTGNWVPNSGLKFGVDFLLYKESPLSYHSSFAVVVKEEFQGEDELHSSSEQLKGRGLTWREVITQDRVAESAGKDLLICHVTKPGGVVEETLTGTCSVDLLTIDDVIVIRWVPEQDRET